MASLYACYHGPEGLKRIATFVHECAVTAKAFLENCGYKISGGYFFDTIRVISGPHSTKEILIKASEKKINLRDFGDGSLGISFDEATSDSDIWTITKFLTKEIRTWISLPMYGNRQ